MVSIMSLWMPILLSAILVFVASSVIHMVLRYHRNDFAKVPSEDGVMDALRPFAIPPGEYVMPHAVDPKERQTEAFIDKANRGPVTFLTVFPNGIPSMTNSLIQWFVYCVVVSLFAAYIASRSVDPGAEYLDVFRFAGTTAFIGYGLALVQNSIWYKRAWSVTGKNLFDALVYGLLTGGAFGWLWP